MMLCDGMCGGEFVWAVVGLGACFSSEERL